MLAVHNDEKEELLERLQKKAILHIKNIRESKLSKDYPEFLAEEEITNKEVEDQLFLLERAIEYLKGFTAQEGFINAFLPQKLSISESTYEEVISSKEPLDIARQAEKLEKRVTEIDRECGALFSQKEFLLPWQKLDVEVETLGSLKVAVLVAGVLNNPPKDWMKKVKEAPLDVETVNEELRRAWILVSYLPEDEEICKKVLAEISFEAVGFEGFKDKPRDSILQIEKKLSNLEVERTSIKQQSKLLSKELNKLLILYDHLTNILTQSKVENLVLLTPKTICIEGWIRAKDYQALEDFTNQFKTASLSKISPEPGENPPVELSNKKVLKNFESITELYGSPYSKELDPSPFLAPFFVIFFALCLTDAFYGLLFAGICLLLMRKVKGDRKLLWVFFAGGIATIFVGAMTGGWFGDFGERFGLSGFMRFRNRFMLFDPMKQPLTFFILALALGFIQVAFGYFLGFVKLVRQGKILEGVAGKLAWDIFWLAILIFGFSFLIPQLQGYRVICVIAAGGSAGLVLFGSGGPSRNIFFKLAKGGFNLYQGFMGTVSDIISYSRLMALGLVTSGLAMSVNILVQLVAKLPWIGFILAPLVFIGGHLFSIAINVLGAYVHTLRLQYAEFFTKFFDGGGEAFKPFRKEAKYILVEKGG